MSPILIGILVLAVANAVMLAALAVITIADHRRDVVRPRYRRSSL